MRAKVYQRPLWLLLLAGTALYAAFWLGSQGKLIYTDETVFAEDFVKAAAGQWSTLEIPHPPLYVWLSSLAVSIWGETLPAMRLVGGMSYIATLWLIPLVLHALTDDLELARRASSWSVGIWLLNPLALQGSLLLDIDNTLVPVSILLLVCVIGLTAHASRLVRIMAVGVVVALMLWVKLLPSNVLILFCLILVALWRRWLFADFLVAVVLGAALFLLSFSVFMWAMRFPVETFAATFGRVQEFGGRGVARIISRLVMGGGITGVWVGIPLALFGVVTALGQVRDLVLRRNRPEQNWLGLFALLGGVLYTAGNELPMGFPRYHYPVVLAVVMLVSLRLATAEWAGEAKRLLVVILILGIYSALSVPDPLLPQYALTFETSDVFQRLRFGLQLQLVALVLPFGAAFLVAWWHVRAVRRAVLLASVAFCAATWIVTTVAQTRADYATIYEYGRHGGWQMGEAVRMKTSAERHLIAPREILWVSQRQGEFVTPMLACAECNTEKVLAHINHTRPGAIVLTTKEDNRYTHITRDPRLGQLLGRCYPERLAIGTYIAFFNNDASCLEQ